METATSRDLLKPHQPDLALTRDGSLWLKVAIVLAVVAFLYTHVVIDMAQDWWNEPSQSQGLLIPPLAIYLAWLRRQAVLAVAPGMDSRGLMAVATACLMLLLGTVGAEFFLTRTSLVLLLVAFIWTFWGLGRLYVLAFPLLLLATMVPLPVLVYNSLAAPLQLFASNVSTELAQSLGVAVYRDGNIIHLANISLGVEEACSGLNSLSALIVASLLLGYLICARVGSRVILALLSIPLAIVVNIFRITGTALMADYKPEFALGFYHSFSGWLVFLVGFGILYGIAWALNKVTNRDHQIAQGLNR
jgi:exosortase